MSDPAERDGEPALVQYWHQEDPPGQILQLMKTFRERNPDMRHVLFDERTAAEFIEKGYGERYAEAFRSCAVPAMQSDYLRFCAVHALGGIYADANFECLRSLRPLLEPGGQLFEQRDGPVLAGLFAFRSSRHPLLAICIEVATRHIEIRLSEISGLMGGPAILTALTHLHRHGSLNRLRGRGRPGWEADVDVCLNEMENRSLREATATHGSLERAFEGVRISGRSEMLTLAKKPPREFESPEGSWAEWEEPAFRLAARRATP